MSKVCAIFDIGKTNKKFILFDENYQEVYKRQRQFKEIKDEDGFPCDDLSAIIKWMRKTLNAVLKDEVYDIRSLNFSTYGASFVYVDKNGKTLTPIYNYLKPYPEKTLKSFHKKYGSQIKIAKETASPASGMLNSGFQLYWLKKTRPNVFKKIKHAFHFPQYFSFHFTGIAVSEYTSIGCHTSLWDYKKEDYHTWVYKEKLDKILPPIVPANTSINTVLKNKPIKIGIGIHDSSAALLPYFLSSTSPFILISTGTWSISLNPFNRSVLTKKELASDCLNYMRIDGHPVKAARLFLGKEHEIQVNKLNKFFKKGKQSHQKIKFSKVIFQKLKTSPHNKFKFEAINWKRKEPKSTQLNEFANFKEAYHQLMIELVALQTKAIRLIIGNSEIKTIYIDGGFSGNHIFVSLLALQFKSINFYRTKSPTGSAIGAAMVINSEKIKPDFLKKQFGLAHCPPPNL